MTVNTVNFTEMITGEDKITLEQFLGTFINKTLDDISNIIGANHIHYPVRNASGTTIPKDTVITAQGTQSGTDYLEVVPLIDPSTQVSCGVLSQDLANNATGLVRHKGVVSDFDTSAWPVKTILYPNSSGGFTDVKPASGQFQFMGKVTRQHANQGTILLCIETPTAYSTTTGAGIVQLVDDLLTADSTKALTANQGVALKALIDSLNSAVILKGTWDASAGTFPTSTKAGESWIVSVGGTVDGVEFSANDRIAAITDGASTSVYAANWHKFDYTDQVLSVDGLTGAVDLSAVYEPKDTTIVKTGIINLFSAVQQMLVTASANAINFTGTNNIAFIATAANITIGTMAAKKGQEGSITIHSAENVTGWGTEFRFAPDFSAVTPTPPANMTGTMKFWYEIIEVNGVDGGTENIIYIAWAE